MWVRAFECLSDDETYDAQEAEDHMGSLAILLFTTGFIAGLQCLDIYGAVAVNNEQLNRDLSISCGVR